MRIAANDDVVLNETFIAYESATVHLWGATVYTLMGRYSTLMGTNAKALSTRTDVWGALPQNYFLDNTGSIRA